MSGRLANQAVAERVTADLVRSREVLTAAQRRALSAAGAGRAAAGVVSRADGAHGHRRRDRPRFPGRLPRTQRPRRAAARVRRQRHGRGAQRHLRAPGPARCEDAWLEPAMSGQPAFGVIDVEGRPYHMALVPAEAGGTIFGFVAAAAPVDDRWAAALRDAGGKRSSCWHQYRRRHDPRPGPGAMADGRRSARHHRRCSTWISAANGSRR